MAAAGMAGILSMGGYVLTQRIRADLRRDVVWYPHRDQVPVERYTRSDRWFPFTVPVFLRWTAQPVGSSRFDYGAYRLLEQGRPYSLWWLEHLLRRNPSSGYGSSGLQAVLGGYDYQLGTDVLPQWETFGLEDPIQATRLTELALRHLDPQRSFWDQVNLQFLQRLMQPDYPHQQRVWAVVLPAMLGMSEAELQIAMQLLPTEEDGIPWEWQLHVAQLRQRFPENAYFGYRNHGSGSRSPDIVSDIDALADASPQEIAARLAEVDPQDYDYALSSLQWSELSDPLIQATLALMAEDENHPMQISAAVAMLLRQDLRDPRVLATALDGDLTRFHAIWDHLALLQLAETFPDSRFTRGARDYGAIRGGTYFGHSDYDFETGEPIPRPFSPREEAARWRIWLDNYADHPGADDATFWLGRTLEWQGQHDEALLIYANWLVDPIGDGDMAYQIRTQFLFLLDVGVSPDQLAGLVRDYANHPLAPTFQYALGIRRARQHNYTEALRLTENLGLDAILAAAFGWGWLRYRYAGYESDPTTFDAQLAEQRQRWQELQKWQALNTSQHRLNLAQHWASWTGWRTGYLALYDGSRNGGTGWYYYRDPDIRAADLDNARRGLQRANHNAQAIILSQPLLTDPQTPSSITEQALFLQISALYRQYASYPPAETQAMIPIEALGDPDPTLYRIPRPDWLQPADPYYDTYMNSQERGAWYLRHTIRLTRQLLAQFPNSRLGDDALMVVYELTQDPTFLEELLQRFPDGDRSEEARVRLYIRHDWDLEALDNLALAP